MAAVSLQKATLLYNRAGGESFQVAALKFRKEGHSVRSGLLVYRDSGLS
jgi:hypothetical protein